ncbi:ribosomal protein l23 domain-containing protein [Ditylenchus destructor]|uniref:Large ribosomal subunit protein uL23m n=1 Tax=Ditylenchus destructor TaxID=166010 RepID=A0AAD4MWM7_9BILA|nr:ribosomal protein l23 domain-containing protein [Ditylenchus destructor]
MSTRLQRLWQPSNPQVRVFLPDFWIKLLETQKAGKYRLPKNAAKFEVDLRMSRYDVREYLEKIYKLPVRDVRTVVQQGEILWDVPRDPRNRRALWKEEDKKYAFVYFKKGFEVEIPELCPNKDETVAVNTEKMKDETERRIAQRNKDHVNHDRAGIGELFG